jgi:phospholipid transport system substrate-binding protein
MHVFSQGQKFKALFKLHREQDGAWKVYDLEIEGISMVKIYSAQYDQFLAKGTPDQLLEKLKAKALAVPDQFKVVARPKKVDAKQ